MHNIHSSLRRKLFGKSHRFSLFHAFEDTQHAHDLAIPLVYDDVDMGNLFSPDSESYWGSCWGSYFKYRKRPVCALEPGCWCRCRARLGAGAAAGCVAWCRCSVLLPDVYDNSCVLWSLRAGTASEGCCQTMMAAFGFLGWMLVAQQGAAARCCWPCAFWNLLAGAAVGCGCRVPRECSCEMSMAVCALELGY